MVIGKNPNRTLTRDSIKIQFIRGEFSPLKLFFRIELDQNQVYLLYYQYNSTVLGIPKSHIQESAKKQYIRGGNNHPLGLKFNHITATH